MYVTPFFQMKNWNLAGQNVVTLTAPNRSGRPAGKIGAESIGPNRGAESSGRLGVQTR